jgi:hypothetical protein
VGGVCFLLLFCVVWTFLGGHGGGHGSVCVEVVLLVLIVLVVGVKLLFLESRLVLGCHFRRAVVLVRYQCIFDL